MDEVVKFKLNLACNRFAEMLKERMGVEVTMAGEPWELSENSNMRACYVGDAILRLFAAIYKEGPKVTAEVLPSSRKVSPEFMFWSDEKKASEWKPRMKANMELLVRQIRKAVKA